MTLRQSMSLFWQYSHLSEFGGNMHCGVSSVSIWLIDMVEYLTRVFAIWHALHDLYVPGVHVAGLTGTNPSMASRRV